jgi:hypothetical protein
MTVRKLTISLPAELAEDAERAVAAGDAMSVSAYVAHALKAQQVRRDALAALERLYGGPALRRSFGGRPPTVPPAYGHRSRMIGGLVVDTSAIVQFASSTSVYAQAAAWYAVAESAVLVVPATALTEAWAQVAPRHRDALDVLLGLPVTIVTDLGNTQAGPIGQLMAGRGDIRVGHVAHTARSRGWPVLTAHATPLRRLDPGLDIEQLT